MSTIFEAERHALFAEKEQLIQQLDRVKDNQSLMKQTEELINSKIRAIDRKIQGHEPLMNDAREYYTETDDVPDHMFDQRPMDWEQH